MDNKKKAPMVANPDEKTAQNKFWLQNSVNEVVEPMMLHVVMQQQENSNGQSFDQIGAMIKYLENKYGERATKGDKNHLQVMRTEADRLEQLVKEMKEKQKAEGSEEKSEKGSEMESDEDDEDDYVDILPEDLAKKQAKGPRVSVSAEVFGQFNKKEDFEPKIIQKSEAVKQAIMDKIQQAFMFSGLDETEKQIVVDAMAEHHAITGEVVIKEGDEGDSLYVVGSGTLTCSKVFKGQTTPTMLKKYQPGEAFGELALLYNAPRAATITSDGEAVLYALDRQTFNHIVKDAAIKRREKYETFLKKVTLLETMDDYERSQIAEAFKDFKYEKGATIIKEGDEGKDMFFLVQGEACATKILNPGEEPKVVKTYSTGDYFGELALLRNEPRAANIMASTECQCVSMDRHSFKRMLGPLNELLKRNIDLYTQYQVQQD